MRILFMYEYRISNIVYSTSTLIQNHKRENSSLILNKQLLQQRVCYFGHEFTVRTMLERHGIFGSENFS